MRVMRAVIVAALCLIASACSGSSAPERITTTEERAFALQIIRALQAGDTETVLKHMPRDLAARIEPSLPDMRALLPSNPAAPARLIDARVELLSAARKVDLGYTMDEGSSRHTLIRLVLVRLDKDVFLRGLRVSRVPERLEGPPPFTLGGKSLGQYLFLLFAVLSAATIVTALYVLYRANNVGRKWPWAIGCAFGLGQFTMNWTSGAVAFHLAGVQLFGVVVTENGPLAPWMIGFGLPIGAYVFLLRQAHARVRERDGTPPRSPT